VSVTASAAGAAPVTLRRVTIADSSSSESSNFHGAALNIAPGADVLLEGCVITRNDASRDGSAIFADVGSRLRLTRGTSVTSNNGTGVYFLGERLALQDAYITGNAAERYGGGIYAQASAGGLERTWVVVNGSVVAGNRAGAGGGGIALGSGARLNLSDSALYRNAAPVGGAVGGLAGSCMVLATRVSFTGEWKATLAVTSCAGPPAAAVYAARCALACFYHHVLSSAVLHLVLQAYWCGRLLCLPPSFQVMCSRTNTFLPSPCCSAFLQVTTPLRRVGV
jgi:hypothetical protein